MESEEMNNSTIELISYAKLAEYDQARTDLPIRKYVLIANFLRDPKSHWLEQHWFDACLNELGQEDEPEPEAPTVNTPSSPSSQSLVKEEKSTSVQLHAYYDFNKQNGFLFYTSSSL
ncbi:hypothetical protein BY458DRAFT_509368 [Sporodiniella umbellata]|nr:hypothetical protein BY458DRAFT_509368 [Sporodiniella umbellata]